MDNSSWTVKEWAALCEANDWTMNEASESRGKINPDDRIMIMVLSVDELAGVSSDENQQADFKGISASTGRSPAFTARLLRERYTSRSGIHHRVRYCGHGAAVPGEDGKDAVGGAVQRGGAEPHEEPAAFPDVP